MPALTGFAAGANPDGGVEVVAIATRSANERWDVPDAVWYAHRDAQDTWSGGTLGRPAGGSLGNAVSIAPNLDGHLEATVASAASPVEFPRMVWHVWQQHPGREWSDWSPLNNPDGGHVLGPVLAQDKDGRLEVITSLFFSGVWHRWQEQPGHRTWKGWQPIGDSLPPGGCVQPAKVTRNHDGRLEVFVVAADQALWHCWQTAAGDGWSHWQSLRTPAIPVGIGPLAVVRNKAGALEAFTIASDGAIWHRAQHEPGSSSWEPWLPLSPCPGWLTDLTVTAQADGALVLFTLGYTPDGGMELWQAQQSSPGGGWELTAWRSFPIKIRLPGVTFKDLVLVPDSRQRLSLFCRISGGRPDRSPELYCRTQRDANGDDWSEEMINLRALSGTG